MNDPRRPRTSFTELHILLAGHTNVGKTSLLRTLGRLSDFGEVSASPSTTRQIQPLPLIETDQLRIVFFDSPGLEQTEPLLEQLDAGPDRRHSHSQRLRALLDEPALQHTAEQELRVLRQALDCDACLFVIDAREPVLEKYLDELFILSRTGRPLLPLLNFTAAADSREQEWRDALRSQGHAVTVAFDAVVYSWESERRLYRSLAAVFPAAEQALDELVRLRSRETDWRLDAACEALASGLIGLAAARRQARADDATAMQAARDALASDAREGEQQTITRILAAFSYNPEILGGALHEDVTDGRWQSDPLSASTLRYYGIKSVGPVMSGLVAGGTVDIAAGGTSLGLGTLTGGLLGAGVAGRQRLRTALDRHLRGVETVVLNEAVLRLIGSRNLQLIVRLQQRGHADQAPLAAANGQPPSGLFQKGLPRALIKAREHPAWQQADGDQDNNRTRAVAELQTELKRAI
ncbi:GTPase/DUF3482 domain-containing protein [Methylonatrum kenyense]|uniref:GTPase/DUF3482 domain-containing protein n=1 Tax=Methylonatrum kenyense TaxID=455253 RepID=UPI0020BF8724|nr:GTPase/DUF3482 domain-containing protein [Methylonatrum kenyense]MCK8517118.1 GTPase/DUF3482 domain-containing protein [Methylonatrum kenyense]